MSFERSKLHPCALLAAWLPAAALAQGAGPSMEHCALIGASADRLACYDKLAGRAPAPAEPAAEQPPPGATPAPPAPKPSTSLLAPTGSTLPANSSGQPQASLLSKYWELDDADKRGIFNFVGYQPNFVLPVEITNRINRSPQSPTHAAVEEPSYKHEESEFQLSLRTKLVQGVPLVGGDFWVAFSQLAFWQVYDRADSTPFRNTDYQPEAIYIKPTGESLRQLPLGWQWRFTELALAHQSNGQADPLSRSWNRFYLGAGFENGDWSLVAKANKRFNESQATDDNPDLLDYRGRYEFQLNWAHGLQTAQLQVKTNLNSIHTGSAQVQWTYPVFRDQPNGLRWFVQGFSGYAETLTDYNFRQTSIGAGLSFLQF